MSKLYRGTRDASAGCIVEVIEGNDERDLNPRFDLANHSPTGFEWGYGGSGPAQLALALCADALGSGAEERALRFYQDIKFSIIANLARDGWEFSAEYLVAAIQHADDFLNAK